MLDLVIIGGSIAGTTAAVYASRRKLNFKMVTGDIGGEVALSGEVENWPLTDHTTGFEMAEKMGAQLKYNGVTPDEGFMVTELAQGADGKTWRVTATNLSGETRVYETIAVIIATGVKPKHLGVPGENEMYHKGVTYCTVCDGPLFKNKITTTIGGGNSALESALMMATITKHVFVINKNDKFKGEQVLIDKLVKLPNVEIIYNAKTTTIEGDAGVTGVSMSFADGTTRTVESQGVMIHIGNTPNSQFANVEKDPVGQIKVDSLCRTNTTGIFAAGDVTNTPYKQIVVAAGMGCTAALAAIEYINRFDSAPQA
ncbi:MAG: FAD-dependent oxidoreductase [Candidatus Magasanikbacteria bacterium]|nr:FAD-dependent oxidoreductase [Candidatus Magasanikbacteria bacterium]